MARRMHGIDPSRFQETRLPTTLIRGRAMITRATGRHAVEEIADGAVLQEDGVIVVTGTYDDLSRRYPAVPVIGTGREILIPGFVNGHHHVGLTPLQLGSPDMPLELWFITRMVSRNLNFYLDTLYSAFEMIGSGITTVQHIHGWVPGTQEQVEACANDVIRAYEDVGMRVSYCHAVRDQNRLVYQDDAAFVASLPPELRGPMRRWFDRFQLGLEGCMDLFHSLHGAHAGKERVRIQLAPANLHWCSDAALSAMADASEKFDVPMHMHLVETAYQKEYAKRRGGGTAVEYLDRFGLMNKRMTLGHGVWLNESDIARVAETGTCICHNCSSNFRLRSGVAALNRFEAHGVNVAIGLDEAGINDDRDMLQEMRLVLRAHRTPGMDDDAPTTAQVFRMATSGGARTTAYGARLGTIEAGRAADLVLLDWEQISFPYLDAETPTLDALIQRAKTGGVRKVLCAGEVIYDDGRFTRVDRDGALRALHDDLARALADDEVERRKLSKALLPHVRKFYAGYFDPAAHVPFYRPSSSV
jgi:cytosine/adenosine deaminase-related metal-dependent hydrolase